MEHPSHFRRSEADVGPILAEVPAASTDGVIDNDDPVSASVAADAVVSAVDDGVGEASFDKDVGDDEFAVDGTEDTFDADDVAEASLDDGSADDADAEGAFDFGVDDLVAALATLLQER